MVLGLVFRRIGWIDDGFASKLNKFVFRVPLPLLVFQDLATVDFSQIWNVKFVLFCFVATLLSITLSAGIAMLWKDKSIRGEFIQASYRSSRRSHRLPWTRSAPYIQQSLPVTHHSKSFRPSVLGDLHSVLL